MRVYHDDGGEVVAAVLGGEPIGYEDEPGKNGTYTLLFTLKGKRSEPWCMKRVRVVARAMRKRHMTRPGRKISEEHHR